MEQILGYAVIALFVAIGGLVYWKRSRKAVETTSPVLATPVAPKPVEPILGTPSPTPELSKPTTGPSFVKELSVDQIKYADGNTPNEDGSVWITSKGESGPVGTKVKYLYGFLDPRKNPELFTWAEAHLLPDVYNDFLQKVANHPRAIWKTDGKDLIVKGGMSTNLFSMSFSDPAVVDASTIKPVKQELPEPPADFDKFGPSFDWNRTGAYLIREGGAGVQAPMFIHPPKDYVGYIEIYASNMASNYGDVDTVSFFIRDTAGEQSFTIPAQNMAGAGAKVEIKGANGPYTVYMNYAKGGKMAISCLHG